MSKTASSRRTVVKGALKVLQLKNLNTDPSYQRDVKAKHKKIVAEFNEEALGIPVVGERSDGTLWIVDGLQRITALNIMGKREVRAEVFASRGCEHEAEVFKLINMNRTKLTPTEEFRALLTAHDPAAWDIKNTAEACGYQIGSNLKGGQTSNEVKAKTLTCINTLRDVHRKWGSSPIKFALETISETWPDDPMGVYNYIVGGLCCFYNQLEGAVDSERLIPRLRGTTPHKVLFTAQQLSIGTGGVGEKVAEILQKIYKKRLVSGRLGS